MKWLLFLLLPTITWAKVVTEKITYEKDGVKMDGIIAYEAKATKQARPGVLVFHNWMGNTEESIGRAKDLAALGYVAFAADIYGSGIRPKDFKEASELATIYKTDRKLMRTRAQAALDALLATKKADARRITAIGYCFGGTVALEMARAQAPLIGVVSFHGGLSTTMKATTTATHILALHGGDDPYVPQDEVIEFQKEMREAKADWQFVSYGNAVHSFTEKAAGNDNSKGAAYNELADQRSWEEMKRFFKEIL